jgi:hypothetical protein
LTRAQKLAAALRVCQRKPKRRRAACIARARKRYGASAAVRTTKRAVGARNDRRAGK